MAEQVCFEYRGFHGCASICGLEIRALSTGQTLVICTELPDNHGTSITNFAEELATLVCKQFEIPPEHLIWVEHYPACPTHGPRPDWDLVTFDLLRQGGQFRFEHPRWRPMGPEDWRWLGLATPE